MGLEKKKIVAGGGSGDCFGFVLQKAQARNTIDDIRNHKSLPTSYKCLI